MLASRGFMIKVHDLKKAYVMGDITVRALDGVSFEVAPNDFVAIMGSSGSGKSTLLNLLGCLDTPSGGSYILRGHEVSTMNDDRLARIRNKEIGFVFQTFNLLPRSSALDNVALPLIYSRISRDERNKRAGKMLQMVGLGDRMDHRPSEMSGGQRQRVAVARALINDPAIILADEPTGNLDSTTSKEIMDLFVNLHRRGNTVVMVTHEEEIAAYCHRVIRMRDGKIMTDERRPIEEVSA
ncbi:MAG: ABC transporter ATP-binding protein [Acidobacteriota bacterium]|nr:ABC transporter ATP-binding protein [Acidobacteriota bacterium]